MKENVEKKKITDKLIGVYDYTVILTYISLFISVIGMTQAMNGRFRTAVTCLALSGLCDMFDGKIARSKKNRTDDEKLYGVQIDSLCDVVCFGVFPALICFLIGVRGPIGMFIVGYYCVCSVIRLAFFNVLETRRQQVEEGANKYYHGLPITSMAIVLVLYFALAIVGTLFIVDFKLKKPDNKTLVFLVIVVAAAVIIVVLFSKYRVPKPHFFEKPLWKIFRG